jgi:hypothetical protein
MDKSERKAFNREYKSTPRPAGIYRVRNSVTRKSLVGSATDLRGMLNRQRFQLENGLHPDRELQGDWDELGAAAFEFGILDQLKPSDEAGYDPTEDLAALKEMWIEELRAAGESLYKWSGRGA